MSCTEHRGFTLIELLVVVGMLAVIIAAFTTSFSAAQNRARINKATNDVKVISQAILAYENYGNGTLNTCTDAEADEGTLKKYIGKSGDSDIPSLLMASFRGGVMCDPWGKAYLITITRTPGSGSTKMSQVETGFALPNYYRLSKDERSGEIWTK